MMLTLRLFPDSLEIAKQLCNQQIHGMENLFFQIGLDMLKRLKHHELIIQFLLKKGKIMDAILYSRDEGLLRTLVPKQFLKATQSIHDDRLFYFVFRFFEQRNLFLYDTIDFPEKDDCEEYILYFKNLNKK